MKKEEAGLCYCKQSTYDYSQSNNVLIGREGQKSHDHLNRCVKA